MVYRFMVYVHTLNKVIFIDIYRQLTVFPILVKIKHIHKFSKYNVYQFLNTKTTNTCIS